MKSSWRQLLPCNTLQLVFQLKCKKKYIFNFNILQKKQQRYRVRIWNVFFTKNLSFPVEAAVGFFKYCRSHKCWFFLISGVRRSSGMLRFLACPSLLIKYTLYCTIMRTGTVFLYSKTRKYARVYVGMFLLFKFWKCLESAGCTNCRIFLLN